MNEHEVTVAKANVGIFAFLKSADTELQFAFEFIFELSGLGFTVFEF
jgi:hypothetical protein